MWNQIFDWFKSQWTLARDLERLQREANEIRQRQEEHTDLLQKFVFELQQERTERRHAHENLLLRLEVELLKFERRLPPPPPVPPEK